jgi:hypothetical protein
MPCSEASLVDDLADVLPLTAKPKQDRERLRNDFNRPNAERLLRFWQVRHASAKTA